MRFLVCIVLFLGVLPASDVSISQSDFVERFVNFVIFFSILWYLGADKVKNIFLQRTQSIIKRFERMQEEEKMLRKQLQEAEMILEDAKAKSAEIIANAKKEAFLIAEQFDMRLEHDIKAINHAFEEILKQEKIEVLKSEVSNALSHASQSLHISNDAYMKILARGIQQ